MSLDIVIGPMFAGKTSFIKNTANRYAAIKTPVYIVKHSIDTRYAYHEEDMVTANETKIRIGRIQSLRNVVMRSMIEDVEVVIVDEAQFFTGLREFVIYVVEKLGKKLYLVGLDGDSDRGVFGELLDCIPLADRVTKLSAFCRRCANGTPGIFSHRHVESTERILIGGTEKYETLCRVCYNRARADAV
jgi:thymidine kinase